MDKVGQSMGTRFPQSIKPESIFQKFHKRRRKPSKEQLAQKAEGYRKWKEASDAINTEEATPLDE